jgi:Arc/MetJ-type ribon-helix-helix transcriptional regulator
MASPRISFRVPEEVREELERICDRADVSISDFAREALYLALLIEDPNRELEQARRQLKRAKAAINSAIRKRGRS